MVVHKIKDGPGLYYQDPGPPVNTDLVYEISGFCHLPLACYIAHILYIIIGDPPSSHQDCTTKILVHLARTLVCVKCGASFQQAYATVQSPVIVYIRKSCFIHSGNLITVRVLSEVRVSALP